MRVWVAAPLSESRRVTTGVRAQADATQLRLRFETTVTVGCWVSACDWELDVEWYEADMLAELHRILRHDWVREGKCHWVR